MSKGNPPRLSSKDFVLIWLGAFLGAILAKLLDYLVGIPCDLAPAWVPREHCAYWAWGLGFLVFIFYSLLVVAAVFLVLRRMRWIR